MRTIKASNDAEILRFMWRQASLDETRKFYGDFESPASRISLAETPSPLAPEGGRDQDTGLRDLVVGRGGFMPRWQKPDEPFPFKAFNAR